MTAANPVDEAWELYTVHQNKFLAELGLLASCADKLTDEERASVAMAVEAFNHCVQTAKDFHSVSPMTTESLQDGLEALLICGQFAITWTARAREMRLAHAGH